MLLKLYSQDGNLKAELQANDGSTQDKEIQADNVLSLGFTLYQYVGIDVNDYVDYMGERYWVIERYQPEEKSSVEWEYNIQLYGIESLIRRFLVLNDNEAVFSLTARPVDHLRLIVKCINEGMGNTTIFKVGSVEGTDNVVIDYTGKYCNEALKELADAVGVEYWFEDDTVNLCRCEFGDLVVIGYGMGLTNLEQDKADNVKFYTRLFPIGSSRNIDRESYGSSRLQLPGGVKYVDSEDLVQKYGIIHHYEQEAFSGIYPRRVGTVSTVRSEEVQDTNGNPFTIYYFKDDALPFDPNEYEIGGLVKHVSFQEGSELAGLGTDDDHYFEVNFNSETKEFEIITIWPYDDDRQLPGDTLVPKPGDKYILWNIRMPDEYYTLAETEFLNAVEGYNRKHILDVSRYKGPTDHVWIEDTGTELGVGRRVRLMSAEYFPELGYRDSRITRISRNVNLPSQMDLEISDALGNGTMAKIDDAINEAKSYAGSILGGVNVPDIIRSWDNKKPTDNNIYSARRSHKEFLSKQNDDTAYGRMTFDKESTFRNGFGSDNFSSGELGSGYHMGKYGNTNDSYLEIDRLLVRKMAYFVELAVKRLSHVGGSIMVSPADLTISNVEVLDDVYRCYVDLTDGHSTINIEEWEEGDLARCQTYNVTQATYYWRAVENVDYVNGYVDLSITDCDRGSGIPKRGDVLVVVGNKTDSTRQNAIEISSTGSSSPSIKIYHGIDSYSLDEKDATSFEYDPTTGRMKMVVYGDMYVGNRLGTNYIKYDQTNGVEIRADKFSYKQTNSQGETVYKEIDEIIEEISHQDDGSFLVWRSETDDEPSASSEPESEWTTDEIRDEHIGDIYLNSDGLCWEYKYIDGLGYFWQAVSDAYLISALQKVRTKKRCFTGVYGTNTPTSGEYSKGDMWVKATYDDGTISYNNEMLVCISDGDWSSFNIADWDLANDYQQRLDTMSEDFQVWKEEIESQVDGTAESFITSSNENPSLGWDVSEYEEHKGDIWYQEDSGFSYYWNGTKWIPSPVDLYDLTDTVDGKNTIFVNKPNDVRRNAKGEVIDDGYLYRVNDIWILENDNVYAGYKEGTIMVATASSNTAYNASHWVKKDCYMGTAEKNALREAGFDWNDNEYHAYADKFFFRSRNVQNPVNVAVFEEVGGKGYIRTDFIRASEIITQTVIALDVNGNVLSKYNGNGNGTVVYYYPNGTKMKEDVFIYNSSGVITGMRTYYYNPDGSVSWYITESGVITNTLAYYWESLGSRGVVVASSATAYSTLASAVSNGQWATKVPTTSARQISVFHADSTTTSTIRQYDGLTCYGNYDNESPTDSTVAANHVTGYVSYETTIQTDARFVNSSGQMRKGYHFGFYNDGKCDAPDAYFACIDGTVWDNESEEQLV